MMFSSNLELDEAKIARQALQQIKAFEQIIGLRILLQVPLDVSSQLPVNTGDFSLLKYAEVGRIRNDCETLLNEFMSCACSTDSSLIHSSTTLSDAWNSVHNQQISMEKNWKQVVDKWHARVNFGSEHVKSKLKVLNFSVWDQVLLLSTSS